MKILDSIWSDGSDLEKGERIRIAIMMTLPLILLTLICFMIDRNIIYIEFLCAIIIFSLFWYPYINVDKYKKNYGLYSEIHFGAPYQYTSKFIPLFTPGIIAFIIIATHTLNKLYLGILISFSFIVPTIGLFLKTNTFNDSSCYINDDETDLGYHSYLYYLVCLLIGIYGNYNSYQYLINGSQIGLGIFLITLLFQIIIINPDIANKILPFEIRTKIGFILFIISTFTAYIIITYLLVGNVMNIPIHPDLTPLGIIRKIITYGTAIAFTYLIYKQAKKMNKKNKK